MITKFTGKGRRFVRKTISFSLVSGFNFSPAFRKMYDLDHFSKVSLFYDDEKKRIGFQFLTNDSQEEGLYKIIEDGTTRAISAKSFTDYFGIDPKQWKGWYEPERVKEPQGIIYWIYLSKRIETKR